MSEYIYATDDHGGHWLTGEEIVRCRDCRHSAAGEAVVSGNWKLGSCNNPRFNGSIHKANVQADGFCKWGERKAMKTNGIAPETNGITSESPLVELPEGGALERLNNWINGVAMANPMLFDKADCKTLREIADMVERDYVRRDAIEEVMDNDRALVAENTRLKAELDVWKAKAEACNPCGWWNGNLHYCERLEGSSKRAAAVNRLIGRSDAVDSGETAGSGAAKCGKRDFDDSRVGVVPLQKEGSMRGCCGTCRHWDGKPDSSGLGSGHCRRYPPVVPTMELPGLWSTSAGGGELLLEHPVTYEEEWCGEWDPADGAQLEESHCGAGKGTRWDSR